MQKFAGLNRPEGRLDGHGLAGHGGGYTETFPSPAASGTGEPADRRLTDAEIASSPVGFVSQYARDP
jgi:hypothetical protein